MLKRRRFEDFNACRRTSYNPASKHHDLLDRLGYVAGQRQFADVFASLEYPEALRLIVPRSTPCCEYLFFPGKCGSNIGWCSWPSYENEVKATAQVVSLQGSSNRCSDLKCRLAEWNRSEWYIGRRN